MIAANEKIKNVKNSVNELIDFAIDNPEFKFSEQEKTQLQCMEMELRSLVFMLARINLYL